MSESAGSQSQERPRVSIPRKSEWRVGRMRRKLGETQAELTRTTAEKNKAMENAGIDSLTQLPNRQKFDVDLKKRIAQAQRTGRDFYLIFIDIDHFKDVNDAYGHSVGDSLLKKIKELRQATRLEEEMYRHGGDEFVQIVENIGEQELVNIARRYQSLIKNESSVVLGNATVVENMKPETTIRSVTDFSIGITRFQPLDTSESLIDRADAAMRHAKLHEDTASFAHNDSRGATHYRQVK